VARQRHLTESKQLYGKPLITGAIGVKDRFGDSGAPWELVKELEVSAEHIAQKAVELMKVKRLSGRRALGDYAEEPEEQAGEQCRGRQREHPHRGDVANRG